MFFLSKKRKKENNAESCSFKDNCITIVFLAKKGRREGEKGDGGGKYVRRLYFQPTSKGILINKTKMLS